jgi:DNA helicase-2/ATP-dependent DNA helicase PcrA
VLFRSVSNDAGPLVDAMRSRSIPFVIKGLNKLFDSPEIQAVVGIFRFMVSELDAASLRQIWAVAELLPVDRVWDRGIEVLNEGRNFDRGSRWGVYNIQRVYLDFLEAIEMREDNVPGGPGRSELLFYQLGKFSQAISDFEQIYFNSEPAQKYLAFVAWLRHQAPDYYADADSDTGYAQPDAVQILTVHQSKGMQWPAVFIPGLRKNRFPSKRMGGLRLDHVIPPTAVTNFDRYLGTLEDETRLFYVAVTRAKKYLFTSWSPAASTQQRKRSQFLDLCQQQQWFLTRDPGVESEKLEPHVAREIPNVTFSFSELKYFFECPYEFKLRFLYGFNPPLHEALGYGKGLHDALSEVHKKATGGEYMSATDAEDLVDRHLFTPFAYPALRDNLRKSAVEAIERYFKSHGDEIKNTVHSEKQIQVHVAPGITVDGRIDLIRKVDTGELSIVDFKSTDRAQAEDVTRDQLHVYAVGYKELTGEQADLVEVLNLDAEGKTQREQIDESLLDGVRTKINGAGAALRRNSLPRLDSFGAKCASCDLVGLCRTRQ